MTEKSMTNKVAFITGSAKRLGANTAAHLHNLGFNVILHCNTSPDEATQLLERLNTIRANSAQLVQGDLCDERQLQQIAEQAVNAFGRLDALINNASAFYPTPVGSITELDWQVLVGSNMKAPLFLSQFCHDMLAQNQGVIINMVDIHADRPLKEHTVYCMAKAALVAMTKSLAQELAPHVRVNGVAPGAILWPEHQLEENDKETILSHIPLQKTGCPQDIAQAIGFLAQAQYVTGQILAVDGGRSISSTSKA